MLSWYLHSLRAARQGIISELTMHIKARKHIRVVVPIKACKEHVFTKYPNNQLAFSRKYQQTEK